MRKLCLWAQAAPRAAQMSYPLPTKQHRPRQLTSTPNHRPSSGPRPFLTLGSWNSLVTPSRLCHSSLLSSAHLGDLSRAPHCPGDWIQVPELAPQTPFI